MPLEAHGITSASVNASIKLLINQLINIHDTTGEFLLHLPDGRIIDTKGWHDWEWTHGIGLYGIWQYYTLTGDATYLAIIEDWFAERFAAGGTTKNINTMAVFLTLAHVYEKTQNQTYLPWLDTWAEWAYHDLERTPYGGMQHATFLSPNTNQLWDDTLMMTVLPLAKIGKLLNRPHYVSEAVRQFLLHIKYLFDPASGLFYHGWVFDADRSRGQEGHNFARARWARGNSWLTIAIPEFLDLLDLPATDPIRLHLLDTLSAQCAALKRVQTPAGLWHTLLDESEATGSYEEASASAGFAYGMLKAGRMRYLAKEGGFDQVAVKGVKAVLENVSPEGELRNVSFGTGMGDSLQFYRDVKKTSMPYGQAMAIMALTEFLRVYI